MPNPKQDTIISSIRVAQSSTNLFFQETDITFSAHTTNRTLQGTQGIQELQAIQGLQRVKELQQIQELNSHNLKAYLASKGAAAVEQLRD